MHHVCAGSAMAALGACLGCHQCTVCSAALSCLRGAGQSEGMAEAGSSLLKTALHPKKSGYLKVVCMMQKPTNYCFP